MYSRGQYLDEKMRVKARKELQWTEKTGQENSEHLG